MGKCKIRSLNVFQIKTWSFYQSISQKWKPVPKWFFIFKQLENCQNKCYRDNSNFIRFCRRTSLHVLMFPISVLKINLWSYWEWQTFEEKFWSFFMMSKNAFIFLIKHLFLIFVNNDIFFKNIQRWNKKYFP